MAKGNNRGYDSVVFPSAGAFQRHDHFEQAACVILDIHLNDESGIEVRHRLKAAGVSLRVIYITGKIIMRRVWQRWNPAASLI
jgi:FixJ family two-component response regulator